MSSGRALQEHLITLLESEIIILVDISLVQFLLYMSCWSAVNRGGNKQDNQGGEDVLRYIVRHALTFLDLPSSVGVLCIRWKALTDFDWRKFSPLTVVSMETLH